MSKYVPDISTRRWVVISPKRLGRPEQYSKSHKEKEKICPLCVNNEKETPPEVLRYGGGEADKPGWKVRVVPNKYSITDIHEVIIHSPDHEKDIESLPLDQIILILTSYRQRYNTYRKRGQVLIFCNHGEHAGGSLAHPHSQLVVIPGQINLDTLVMEPLNNIVEENKLFHIYCPDFSQWPYEMWIAPKKQNVFFGDVTDAEINELAVLMVKMLKRLAHIYQQHTISNLLFGYNYYIYHKENWDWGIIHRFLHRGGFELGTGLYVNIVDPLEAALELKGVEKKMIGVLKKLKKY